MFSGNSVVSRVMLILVIIVLMCGVWQVGWILVNIGGSRLLWFMIMKMCGCLMIIISIIDDRLISVLIFMMMCSQFSCGCVVIVVIIGLLVFSNGQGIRLVMMVVIVIYSIVQIISESSMLIGMLCCGWCDFCVVIDIVLKLMQVKNIIVVLCRMFLKLYLLGFLLLGMNGV